jgi:ribonuclease R
MSTSKRLDLAEKVLRLLAATAYQPLNKTDLAKRLGVDLAERANFRRLLRRLETEGKIARIKKDRYVLPQEADLVTGIIQFHPQGFAFVIDESGNGAGDLYIATENTGTALHRDRVVARVIRERPPELRPSRRRAEREGRIIRILKRANPTIVGTLQRSKNFHYVVPDDPCLVRDIYVRIEPGKHPQPPRENDKVVVRVEEWIHRHVNPEGEIIEVLGPANRPGVGILAIIKKHRLATEFPGAALEEAEKIEVTDRDLEQREDLRSEPIFTIDPEDARDFDDAIHVEELEDGWRIGIHIADVSHFVKPGSALDREAFARGNSVYLPDRVLPMLPERLSNGVCSLRPDEDHLTKSVIVELDRRGEIRRYRFAATVIRSRARLTYAQAFKLLQKKPGHRKERAGGHGPEARDKKEHGQHAHATSALQYGADHIDLHRAWDAASLLRRRRFQRGALDLEMPEVRVLLDEQGHTIGLKREEHDIAHQLIEEFMLLANQVVAAETRNNGVPSVYRVHENPDPARIAEFREAVLSYGIQIGDLSHRREVQRLLKILENHPESNVLKVGLLRSLKKAQYSPEPLGHYGLAKADYTHFTSPIRRYADLIVHRSFNSLLPKRQARRSLPRSSDLAAVCEHISTTERVAADAEREAVKLKKLEYFQTLLRKPHGLEATVIDVRNYGLLVEVEEALFNGLVHISALDNDFFVFDAARARIYGRRSKVSYAVGDRVSVRTVAVDIFKQQIDFEIVEKIS